MEFNMAAFERGVYGTDEVPEGAWKNNLGHTVVKSRWRWHKDQLAQHRKNRSSWTGTKEEWAAQEAHLLERVGVYRALMEQPFYAKKLRESANRLRRVQRPRLVTRKVEIAVCTVLDGPRRITDEHRPHLPFMLMRIRKKRFKSMVHLAYCYRKPVSWIRTVLNKGFEDELITREELKTCFRQPGRPRTGPKRGPYKKSQTRDFA